MKCKVCFYNLKKKDLKLPKYFRGVRVCTMCFNRRREEERLKRQEEKRNNETIKELQIKKQTFK